MSSSADLAAILVEDREAQKAAGQRMAELNRSLVIGDDAPPATAVSLQTIAKIPSETLLDGVQRVLLTCPSRPSSSLVCAPVCHVDAGDVDS
jgi:hypothetical protein